jgi:methylamine dehydrogenase accessory protein MauD
MTALTISSVVLWILQISTVIVVVGLARQVGVLHLRVRPLGAGQPGNGPEIGTRLDLTPVSSIRGVDTPLLVSGHLSLVMFASPECSACGSAMQAVKHLRSTERDVWFVIAVDGKQQHGLEYAAKYGLTDVAGLVSSDSLPDLGYTSRPFAVVLADEGTVLGSGVPNTLEQLEVLLATARLNSLAPPDPANGSTDVLPGQAEEGGKNTDELPLIDIIAQPQGLDG